eukprot:6201346-Pleurochrysis_carterae.AAC.2
MHAAVRLTSFATASLHPNGRLHVHRAAAGARRRRGGERRRADSADTSPCVGSSAAAAARARRRAVRPAAAVRADARARSDSLSSQQIVADTCLPDRDRFLCSLYVPNRRTPSTTQPRDSTPCARAVTSESPCFDFEMAGWVSSVSGA